MSQVPPINPYDTPETPRTGMSTSGKVLLGLGIGCGVMLLLCCGFFGFGTWWAVNSLQKSVTDDIATVRRITEEIVSIDVPESLPPKGGIDFKMPFVGTVMIGVAYVNDDRDNVLLLGQFGEMFNDENMQRQWRDAMRNPGGDPDDIEVEESEKHEMQIHGEPANFRVARGRSAKSKEEVWQVTGGFKGKGGPALLMLKVRSADFTKEQVLAILNSMK